MVFTEKASNELATVESRVEDLRQRLGEEFAGSTDELRQEMQSAKSATGDKKRQLEKVVGKTVMSLLYYPVMLSHFSPAPVKTERAVRIQ